jgi:hypothetical protein
LASLDVKGKGKLGPKFLGPFKVLDKVGTIAYRLELPAGTKLHDIFHVGLLKSFRGEPPSVPGTLPPICHGRACIEPMMVEKSRVVRGKLEVLVQWKGLAATEASWMPLEKFCKLYPSFQLPDKLIVQGERCHGGDNLQEAQEIECGSGG